MRSRAAAWLAWSMCTVSLSLMAFSLLLIVFGWSTPLPRGWTPWMQHAVFLLGVIGAPVLGGLIAARRPENLYGWVWLGLGMSFALLVLAEPYAAYALVVDPGSLPAPRALYYVLRLGWEVAVTLVPFVLLLFPTGRLPSGRWRFLAWILLAAGGAIVPLALLNPANGSGPIENPFALGGVAGEAITTIDLALGMVIFAAFILSALSLVIRYHGASGVERQQLKWFALAAVVGGGLIVADVLSADLLLGAALWNLLNTATFAGFYLAVGIALLRYRLYEIDIIINRTLVYGVLTGTLVALYFGSIVLLQRVFVLLTGERATLAIVASTLLIAALFNPLRRRIQSFIDRRFYRRKYDAEKTLETFGARLRDETDLEALTIELVGVVRETMQPTHVFVWLRPDAGPKEENKPAEQPHSAER
jgi:hypothetical protein